RGARRSGLDRDLIIAAPDVRIENADVAGGGWVNAVGIPRGGGAVDLDAPCGESVRPADDNVKIRRVAQRDAIEGEIVRLVGGDQPGNILPGVFPLRPLGQVPPANVMADEAGAAPAVDYAIAHHTR